MQTPYHRSNVRRGISVRGGRRYAAAGRTAHLPGDRSGWDVRGCLWWFGRWWGGRGGGDGSVGLVYIDLNPLLTRTATEDMLLDDDDAAAAAAVAGRTAGGDKEGDGIGMAAMVVVAAVVGVAVAIMASLLLLVAVAGGGGGTGRAERRSASVDLLVARSGGSSNSSSSPAVPTKPSAAAAAAAAAAPSTREGRSGGGGSQSGSGSGSGGIPGSGGGGGLSSGTIDGWFPLYDTLGGVRGELGISVKLTFIGDTNPFRDSSAGVQLFPFSDLDPGSGYTISHVFGFVEELVVSNCCMMCSHYMHIILYSMVHIPYIAGYIYVRIYLLCLLLF